MCALALLASIAGLIAAPTFWLAWLSVVVFAALVAVGVHDLRQTRHAILRNYPVIGHLRFLLEFIRPEMR